MWPAPEPGDLFTLSVLVLALGVAVGAANFFGASMALGAFLSGMVVGQSEFSSQAAAAALPTLNSDWPTTMPLRKAPRAMEAPKKLAAPTATPRARTRTEGKQFPGSGAGHIGKELGDDPLADHQSEDHERPEFQCRNGKDVPDAFGLFVAADDGGQKYQQKDGEEISTTSQPRATWPVVVCSALLSERTRVRTTVLATEMAMPKTAPAAHDQPKPCETTMPSKVAAPIWAAAPGRTIRWTASRLLDGSGGPRRT